MADGMDRLRLASPASSPVELPYGLRALLSADSAALPAPAAKVLAAAMPPPKQEDQTEEGIKEEGGEGKEGVGGEEPKKGLQVAIAGEPRKGEQVPEGEAAGAGMDRLWLASPTSAALGLPYGLKTLLMLAAAGALPPTEPAV
eukprot:gene5756-52062_t